MGSKIINLCLAVCAFAISLCIAEALSRSIYPVLAGPSCISLNGERITAWTKPGCTYRQVSSEYDALTTITGKGYRVPEAQGNPEVVFLGDSFTFGEGLNDKETFPYIYARSLNVQCANLACPGYGTGEEIDRLEAFLTQWNWRPRTVKLFMFAMTSSLAGGNDIIDNLSYADARQHKQTDLKTSTPGARQKTIRDSLRELWAAVYNYCRSQLLQNSNLARIIKFQMGTKVRSLVTLEIDRNQLDQALAITEKQLARLKRLSQEYGFQYEIFLLNPVQDIIRATAGTTLWTLSRISPVPIQGTSPLFKDNPQSFYYHFDGHFNQRGSAAVAQFLIARERNPK